MKRLASYVLLASIILASCIKEDRSKCPCYLHVDLSKIDTNYIGKLDLVMSGRGEPLWTPVGESSIGDTLILRVPKEEIEFCAWGNLNLSAILPHSRTIVPGEMPDSLWSYSEHLVTRCEDIFVTVKPKRQYIPLTIIVRGMLEKVSDIRPVLTSVSNSLSFEGDATSERSEIVPVEARSPELPSGYYQFSTVLLTQQSATEAFLDLSFKEDGKPVNASYPIGQMLLDIGENISLTDQKPVVMDIVIGRGSLFVTLSVAGWQVHATIDITY